MQLSMCCCIIVLILRRCFSAVSLSALHLSRVTPQCLNVAAQLLFVWATKLKLHCFCHCNFHEASSAPKSAWAAMSNNELLWMYSSCIPNVHNKRANTVTWLFIRQKKRERDRQRERQTARMNFLKDIKNILKTFSKRTQVEINGKKYKQGVVKGKKSVQTWTPVPYITLSLWWSANTYFCLFFIWLAELQCLWSCTKRLIV